LNIHGQECEHENDDQVLGHELEMSKRNKNPKKLILPSNYNSNFSADTIDNQTMEQDESKAQIDHEDENRQILYSNLQAHINKFHPRMDGEPLGICDNLG